MNLRILTALVMAALAWGQAKKGAPAKSAQASNKLLNPAALTARAPDRFKARFVTTKGEFVLSVRREWAPLGADRFYNLASNGFYDGCAFFRVAPSYVVQFGLNPNPAIQAVWEKNPLKDEPVRHTNGIGYAAYAAAGAHTRTTQIFISMRDNKSLDVQGFSPFGDVTSGLATLVQLYSGYGEKIDQQRVIKLGAAYLRAFPKLDSIKKVVIE